MFDLKMGNKKDLKTAYLAEIAKAWGHDETMMSYFKKTLSDVYELTDGKLFAFDKQKIKTRFCFGYGQYATASYEEMQATEAVANSVYNDKNYFFDENLKEIDKFINLLKTGRPSKTDNWEHYVLKLVPVSYYGAPALNIWNIRAVRNGQNCEDNSINCSNEDRELLLSALANERAKLCKRLNSYLKKYGLAKIQSWTYLQD